MPSSLSNIAAKDGASATVAGGILAIDKSGAGTGPFIQTSVLSDTQGVNTATIKAASTASIATDTALVVALSPNNVLGAVTATANALDINIKSGANPNGQTVMASSAPVVIASNQSSVPVTPSALVAGTASIGTVQTGVTATSNGATASRVNAAATTNATSLKASAGQLYTIDVFNAAAYNVFLKLYNKASAPTVGTDTPVMTIPVQAGGGYSKTWPMGYTFGTGVAYAITKLQADSDTTVVVAGDLTGNTTWI